MPRGARTWLFYHRPRGACAGSAWLGERSASESTGGAEPDGPWARVATGGALCHEGCPLLRVRRLARGLQPYWDTPQDDRPQETPMSKVTNKTKRAVRKTTDAAESVVSGTAGAAEGAVKGAAGVAGGAVKKTAKTVKRGVKKIT